MRIWPADLADPRAPQQLQERAVAEGVAVDILVNNAGFGAIGHFQELPPERQLGIIDVNMRALTEMTYISCRRCASVGAAASSTRLDRRLPAGPYMAVYYASKAYVVSFSEALAEELLGSGVTVSCLCPGYTATEFQKAAGIAKTGLLARLSADAGADGLCGDRGAHRLSRPDGRRACWSCARLGATASSVFGLRFRRAGFTVGAASRLQKPR